MKNRNSTTQMYLPTMTFADYLNILKKLSPKYSNTVETNNKHITKGIEQMNKNSVDFEENAKGGRGDSYRLAQTNATVRLTGITQMLSLITKKNDVKNLSDTLCILDVLGGDGTIMRALETLRPERNKKKSIILTSDISPSMITGALAYGLPAIRQSAQHLLLKESSFDGVIIAYGTHHIPYTERLVSCKEAYRVLKPGGVFVIHDFEENSTQSAWFSTVVHDYSLTGHLYPHVRKIELQGYLENCGLKNIKIIHLYDPFITSSDTKEKAYRKLMSYVINMYGLEKLKEHGKVTKTSCKKVYDLIRKHIVYDYTAIPEAKSTWKNSLFFYKKGGLFFAEMPRLALVGTGTK